MPEQVTIERTFHAPLALVWELWTSADGIASWFGPRGWQVTVSANDLRVGGTFTYTMRPTDPATVAAMAKKGMPAERTVTSTWTVLDPPRRATYVSPMGPPGEEMTTAVTFTETADGVAMHLVVGATMDGVVQGAAMGWRSSLGRLEEQLSAHA